MFRLGVTPLAREVAAPRAKSPCWSVRLSRCCQILSHAERCGVAAVAWNTLALWSLVAERARLAENAAAARFLSRRSKARRTTNTGVQMSARAYVAVLCRLGKRDSMRRGYISKAPASSSLDVESCVSYSE